MTCARQQSRAVVKLESAPRMRVVWAAHGLVPVDRVTLTSVDEKVRPLAPMLWLEFGAGPDQLQLQLAHLVSKRLQLIQDRVVGRWISGGGSKCVCVRTVRNTEPTLVVTR